MWQELKYASSCRERKSTIHFCLHDEAETGCSRREYLPWSCWYWHNSKQNSKCIIDTFRFAAYVSGSDFLSIDKFCSAEKYLHMGENMSNNGLVRATRSRARWRHSARVKSHGCPWRSCVERSREKPGPIPICRAIGTTRGTEYTSLIL